jgi:hypothetical protein
LSAYRFGATKVTQLTEQNGAPRHEEDKTAAIVRGVTEQLLGPLQKQHRVEVRAMREIADRIERGYTNLAKTLEAIAIGEEELAIAGVTDGESKELPNFPRYKAEATVIYRLTAKDIGKKLGLSHMLVSYFLGPAGLCWLEKKPTMWNGEMYRMTRRRLWHVDIVNLLKSVIVDPQHDERSGLSTSCSKRMDSVASDVRKIR